MHRTTVERDGAIYLADPVTAFDQLPRCGAKTRDGRICLNPARLNGRCRMHGGRAEMPTTPRHVARVLASKAAARAIANGHAKTVPQAIEALRGLLMIRLSRLAEQPDEQITSSAVRKITDALARVEKLAVDRGIKPPPADETRDTEALRRDLLQRFEALHSQTDPPPTDPTIS